MELFESIDEYRSTPIRPAAYMICDEGRMLKELLRLVAEIGSEAPIIAYASAPTIPRIVRAISAGAINYLSFPFDNGDLQMLAGTLPSAPISPIAKIRRRVTTAQSRLAILTPREQAVLEGIVDGHSNKEIVRMLGISPRTVEIHRANLMVRLGAKSSAEAIKIAVESDFAALIERVPLSLAA